MQVSNNGVLITPSIKKYLDVIKSGKIEEREIIAMKSLIARNKDAARVIFDALNEAEELELSEEQNSKGIAFLLDKWKTPRGIERKNSPFGYREQKALETFEKFTLSGFYNTGRHPDFPFYVPIYECYGKDGYFQYYYNGEINIVG